MAAPVEVVAAAATAVAATQAVLPVTVFGSAVRSLRRLQSSDEVYLTIMVARTFQDRGNTDNNEVGSEGSDRDHDNAPPTNSNSSYR